MPFKTRSHRIYAYKTCSQTSKNPAQLVLSVCVPAARLRHRRLTSSHRLPEDSLWKVLAIVRTESLDAGAVVVGRGRPSSTLYIVRAGRVETSYDGGERLVGAGASFGELCVLGLSTVSLVDATCVVQSDFFFIHRDRFLNTFSNLPEVLAEMAAREDVYRRRPVRVPKASLGST